VLLLVDAVEGHAATRFVTRKALALGLKPIVVSNKIVGRVPAPISSSMRRSTCSTSWGAQEEQLDFPSWRVGTERYAVDRSRVPSFAPSALQRPALRSADRREVGFDAAAVRGDSCATSGADRIPDGTRCSCRSARSISPATSARSGIAGCAAAHTRRAGRDRIDGPEGRRCAPFNQADVSRGWSGSTVDEGVAGDIVLLNGFDESTSHAVLRSLAPEALPCCGSTSTTLV